MIFPITEDTARALAHCVACGELKDGGCVVCWECFKRSQRFTPLKFYQGSFEQWQGHVMHSRDNHAAIRLWSFPKAALAESKGGVL